MKFKNPEGKFVKSDHKSLVKDYNQGGWSIEFFDGPENDNHGEMK